MFYRSAVRVGAYLLPAICLLWGVAAKAQGVPFTIIRPPDGATVRENVAIQVPRASIPAEGYVAVYIDGKFVSALYPQGESDKPFTYIWDTKGLGVSDGEHAVRLVLFGPAPNESSGTMQLGSSEVRLNVANKIQNGPSVLHLRYRFPNGYEFRYSRDGSAVIVGGFSETGTSSDIPLTSISSRLVFDIEQPLPEALVRNKLTSLTIRQNGNEYTVPDEQLTTSVYELLDSLGQVHYEVRGSYGNLQTAAYNGAANGAAVPAAPFDGAPVADALHLPVLPEAGISVDETWISPQQRLDIPGLPAEQQPKITLHSRLVDLEWQNGYPTAKIHQSYDSTSDPTKLPESLVISGILILKPKIQFDRDIYFAYTAGRVVKMVSKLTIKGDTPSQINNASANGLAGGESPGGMPFGGPGGAPYGAGYPGMPGMPYGSSSPYGMGAAPTSPYGSSAPYGGGAPYGRKGGGMGMGGPGVPVGGSSSPYGGASPYGGGSAYGGYPGSGYPGMPGSPYGSSSPYGMGAGTGAGMPGVGGVLTQQALHSITVRLNVVTNLAGITTF